jgi:hypothetical protein
LEEVMKKFKTLALTGLACTMPLATANATMLTGGFTGNWYNPETDGQGFQLQVLPNGEALALWFTYDADGNQVWLIGNNRIVGNKVTMDMLRPKGARFGPAFNPDDVEMQPFGSVTLTFEDCNSGSVTWESDDPQFGWGEMNIQRLTKSAGASCSASLADNRSGDEPVLDFKVALLNDSPYRDAKAKAEYESRPGRVEFEVELEGVPEGDYTLLVDEVERGTIRVEWDDDDTEGYIEFSSPRDDDEFTLNFEPLGKLIEITDGSTVLFSGVLDPELGPETDSSDGPSGPSLDFGQYDIDIDFDNTGLDPDAYGDLSLDIYPNRVEFEVEVEDLEIGTYTLMIGESDFELEVISYGDDTEGELEFSNPAESGKLFLDFDPRGQFITVEKDGSVFLSAQFPIEGVPDDDDDMTTEDADDDVTMDDEDDVTNDDDDATNDDGDDDVTNDDDDATNDDGDDDVTNDDDDATNDDGDDDVTNDDEDTTDGDEDDDGEDDATGDDEDDGDDDETDEDDDGDV